MLLGKSTQTAKHAYNKEIEILIFYKAFCALYIQIQSLYVLYLLLCEFYVLYTVA